MPFQALRKAVEAGPGLSSSLPLLLPPGGIVPPPLECFPEGDGKGWPRPEGGGGAGGTPPGRRAARPFNGGLARIFYEIRRGHKNNLKLY